MMRIQIYVAEKKMPPFYRDAAQEYVKRLGRYAKVRLILQEKKDFDTQKKAEHTPAAPGEATSIVLEQAAPAEYHPVLRKESDYTMVVSAKGEALSSEKFAQKIEKLGIQGRSSLDILVGWPQEKGDFYLKLTEAEPSLSMEAVLMTEQLYRSFRILQGAPYHK